MLFRSLIAFVLLTSAQAQEIKRDIPYATPNHERQVLDVYSPAGAKHLPVVFWIHGGGWQAGDKSSVQLKPKVFTEKGFVFVSTNYRLLPNVEIDAIFRDIAKSIHWVHDHIAEHGGDPQRMLVMGHSAGAQLAALICTDERYLKAEGLSLSFIKGCVPVDGDTYDVPAIIETAETRRRVVVRQAHDARCDTAARLAEHRQREPRLVPRGLFAAPVEMEFAVERVEQFGRLDAQYVVDGQRADELEIGRAHV